jgi:hypothetical protein
MVLFEGGQRQAALIRPFFPLRIDPMQCNEGSAATPALDRRARREKTELLELRYVLCVCVRGVRVGTSCPAQSPAAYVLSTVLVFMCIMHVC